MKKLFGWIGVGASAAAAAIIYTHQPHHPPAPVTPPPVAVVATHAMGVIVADADGRGLAGATVQIDPASATFAPTNGDGYTVALTVPEGTYHVTASLAGYHGDPVAWALAANADVAVTLTRDGPPPCGALTLDPDHRFRCTKDGRIWQPRYVTGFPLLELLAHGKEAQADAFLTWAQTEGFNGVRVLSMIAITAQLTPDEGAAAFPALAGKLKARGMGLELVALADTRSYPGLDLGGQVQRVCAEARGVDQPVTVETANEPYHATQSDAVHDYSNLPKWSQGCGVPVAYGAGANDYDSDPQGDYVTRHLDRGRDLWNRVRRVKDLGDLAASLKKLVGDDEPIGADETDQPGKRSAQPQEFFAQGVLDRLFGLASTFHCTDCIGAKVPGTVQQQCAAAYIAGATLVPDDASFQYLNDHYGVTDGADWSKVIKVYSFIGATKSYTVLIGLTGDPAVKWVNGWHPVGVIAERPGIQVVEIAR